MAKYKEPAFGPDQAKSVLEKFRQVIETRRSVRMFDGTPIPEPVVRECIRMALLAPNSSNLQPWEFHWVRDPELKKKLAVVCMGQRAASTAAELIVCVARLNTWRAAANQMLKVFDEVDRTTEFKTPAISRVYYSRTVRLTYWQGWGGWFGLCKRVAIWFVGLFRPITRGPASHADMRVWAIKSTSLACENLMLAFRAHGFDSCPMEGTDHVRIEKLLNLPHDAEIAMVIGAGKRAENGVYTKQVRFDSKHYLIEH